MNSIRNIARLNEAELEKVIPPNASWHTDYRDTAYIHIGGLPLDLSEGDVLLIFSQYGNPTDVKLARDKDSGKSRGFGWLKYEDQRSCDLAVDNLSGASVLGRLLSVDHARYKMKDGERETVGEEEEDGTGREGERTGGKRRRSSEESESEEERSMIKEEVDLAKLLREHDEDDPMKAYLVQEKRKEVEEALKAVSISKPQQKEKRKREYRDHHRSKRDDSEDGEGRRSNGHRSRRKEGRSRDDDDEDGDKAARSSRRKRSASIEDKRRR